MQSNIFMIHVSGFIVAITEDRKKKGIKKILSRCTSDHIIVVKKYINSQWFHYWLFIFTTIRLSKLTDNELQFYR